MTLFYPNGEQKEEQFAYDSESNILMNMRFEHTVILASDGFGSFYTDDGPSHPPIMITPDSIAPGFINFKGKKGSFLQRRASKEVKNLNNNGVFHFDDLSIGAYIYEGPKHGDISTEQPNGRTEVSS